MAARCPKHGIARRLPNGLHACFPCAEELVQGIRRNRKTVAVIAARFKNALSHDEYKKFSTIMQEAKPTAESEEDNLIVVFLACEAACTDMTIDQLLEQFKQSRSLASFTSLLPVQQHP